MTFAEAKAEQARLERESAIAGDELRSFPRNAMGLVSDATRATPEYRIAKARSDAAHTDLRNFNEVFTKKFAKELRAVRAARFGESPSRSKPKRTKAKRSSKKRRTLSHLRRVRFATGRRGGRGFGVLRHGVSARSPLFKILPEWNERRARWIVVDPTTLYSVRDIRTGSLRVLPGTSADFKGVGPEVSIHVATRAEAEKHWQSPLHSSWKVR